MGGRQAAVGDEKWIEVAVQTPIAACKQRTSAFYAQSPEPSYDAPRAPALNVDGSRETTEVSARRIVELLDQRGLLGGS